MSGEPRPDYRKLALLLLGPPVVVAAIVSMPVLVGNWSVASLPVVALCWSLLVVALLRFGFGGRYQRVVETEPPVDPSVPRSLEERLAVLRERRREGPERAWETWTSDGVELVLERVGVGFTDWVRGRRVVVLRARAGGLEVDGTWFEAMDLKSLRLENGRLLVEAEQGTWTGPAMVVPEPGHVVELLQHLVVNDADRQAEVEAEAEARRALKRIRPGWSSERSQ